MTPSTDDAARALVMQWKRDRHINVGEPMTMVEQSDAEALVTLIDAALREAEARVADEVERTRDLVLRGLVDVSEAFNGLLGWCRAQAAIMGAGPLEPPKEG